MMNLILLKKLSYLKSKSTSFQLLSTWTKFKRKLKSKTMKMKLSLLLSNLKTFKWWSKPTLKSLSLNKLNAKERRKNPPRKRKVKDVVKKQSLKKNKRSQRPRKSCSLISKWSYLSLNRLKKRNLQRLKMRKTTKMRMIQNQLS